MADRKLNLKEAYPWTELLGNELVPGSKSESDLEKVKAVVQASSSSLSTDLRKEKDREEENLEEEKIGKKDADTEEKSSNIENDSLEIAEVSEPSLPEQPQVPEKPAPLTDISEGECSSKKAEELPADPAVYKIRRARETDVAAILSLVKELADYEKASHEVLAKESDIHELLFIGATTPGGNPAAYCHVAEKVYTEFSEGTSGIEIEREVREVVGLALWHLNVSTWRGRYGIYLEDLYVTPSCRGKGLGKALLQTLQEECDFRGYPRLTWQVSKPFHFVEYIVK
jgi:ribosomal protein S18 acetylase RimI-like enzyme